METCRGRSWVISECVMVGKMWKSIGSKRFASTHIAKKHVVCLRGPAFQLYIVVQGLFGLDRMPHYLWNRVFSWKIGALFSKWPFKNLFISGPVADLTPSSFLDMFVYDFINFCNFSMFHHVSSCFIIFHNISSLHLHGLPVEVLNKYYMWLESESQVFSSKFGLVLQCSVAWRSWRWFVGFFH